MESRLSDSNIFLSFLKPTHQLPVPRCVIFQANAKFFVHPNASFSPLILMLTKWHLTLAAMTPLSCFVFYNIFSPFFPYSFSHSTFWGNIWLLADAWRKPSASAFSTSYLIWPSLTRLLLRLNTSTEREFITTRVVGCGGGGGGGNKSLSSFLYDGSGVIWMYLFEFCFEYNCQTKEGEGEKESMYSEIKIFEIQFKYIFTDVVALLFGCLLACFIDDEERQIASTGFFVACNTQSIASLCVSSLPQHLI